jgi:sugar phosphate isomerase/epimerase
MTKSLKRAYKLEASLWVLHSGRFTPFTYYFPEKAWNAHNNSLLALSQTAKDYGIRIAVENMPGQYELVNNVPSGKKLLDEIQRDNVGICLDIGHANIREGVKPFYTCRSPEIIHIHIHDNKGKADSHLTLGQGNIDWKNFRAWLTKIKYDGWIVLENYEFNDVQQGIKVLANLEASPITTKKASEP